MLFQYFLEKENLGLGMIFDHIIREQEALLKTVQPSWAEWELQSISVHALLEYR